MQPVTAPFYLLINFDMNDYCFVIQPFDDGGKFDKRYEEVYKAAIDKTGIESYRIDKDPSTRNIISEIEEKIASAKICFADISEDNPNVWYELGFAFASGKDVVMVSDSTREKFPFDISHKSIIKYKSESRGDFDELQSKIEDKIKALLEVDKVSKNLLDNPLKETDGLASFDMALLAILFESDYENEGVTIPFLNKKMEQGGYNNFATRLAIENLQQREYINMGFNDSDVYVCCINNNGISFIKNNYNQFNLRTIEADLPF